MEVAFDAIGLEISNIKTINLLAETADERGEVSRLKRREGILHGRCWKLGEGIEVWTVLFESPAGDFFYADCRPGFRAKFQQKISPWTMTEFEEEGQVIIHGYCQNSETEILFELQNLTEVGTSSFSYSVLNVGLCGLAYQAQIISKRSDFVWQLIEKESTTTSPTKNNWELVGEIISFRELRNPLSGNDLYWLYLNIGKLNLEVLVSKKMLKGQKIEKGRFLAAKIWLQGHIFDGSLFKNRYEGVEPFARTIDFWKKFKRLN